MLSKQPMARNVYKTTTVSITLCYNTRYHGNYGSYRGNNTPPYKVHCKHRAVSMAKQRVQNQVPENQSLNISLSFYLGYNPSSFSPKIILFVSHFSFIGASFVRVFQHFELPLT